MLVKLRMMIVVTWRLLVHTKLNLCGKTSRNPERSPSSFSRNFLCKKKSWLWVRLLYALETPSNYLRGIVPTSSMSSTCWN